MLFSYHERLKCNYFPHNKVVRHGTCTGACQESPSQREICGVCLDSQLSGISGISQIDESFFLLVAKFNKPNLGPSRQLFKRAMRSVIRQSSRLFGLTNLLSLPGMHCRDAHYAQPPKLPLDPKLDIAHVFVSAGKHTQLPRSCVYFVTLPCDQFAIRASYIIAPAWRDAIAVRNLRAHTSQR